MIFKGWKGCFRQLSRSTEGALMGSEARGSCTRQAGTTSIIFRQQLLSPMGQITQGVYRCSRDTW